MASEADIDAVRDNTNEPKDTSEFTDEEIGALIDEYGVDVASATIWQRKAATYADLVDVTEAGATHKFSDLHKSALEFSAFYTKKGAEVVTPVRSRPRVVKIVRQ